MLYVDRVKAELKRLGYTGQDLGEEGPTVYELFHGTLRNGNDDALNQLTADVAKNVESANTVLNKHSTASTSAGSVLSQAGNVVLQSLQSSASTPAGIK